MNKQTLATAALALLSFGALAVGTADANVTGLVDDAKATFDAVLPIALTVLGTFIAVAIGVRTWNRVS